MAEWLPDRVMRELGIEPWQYEEFRAAVERVLKAEGAW